MLGITTIQQGENQSIQNCKITVLKKLFDGDLAKKYCLNETSVCYAFEVGQEFIAKYPQKRTG